MKAVFPYILLFVGCYFSNSSASIFFSLDDAQSHEQYALVADVRMGNPQSILYDVQAAILDFSFFLNYCNDRFTPMIIIVPPCLEGVGPLEDKALFIEGARTALTWTWAYYQVLFGIIDPLIITMAPDTPLHADDLWYYVNKKQGPCRTLSEENRDIKHCFNDYFFIDSGYRVACCLVPFDVKGMICQTITMLTASLPVCNPKQKRYLVSGGAGLIGSNLTRHLLNRGDQVMVIDNLSSGSIENLRPFFDNPHFCYAIHDISVPFELEEPFDVVIHCASLPSPAIYYTKPYQTLLVGLQGTKNTLEVARTKNARYLFTSTSEVYGDPLMHPQPESYGGNVDCMGKRSAYDQSKRGAEVLIKLYFEHYGVDVRVARLFNTYGPGMRLADGRVVNNFLEAVINNKPLKINGSGNQTRSFAYVDDTLDGICRLIDNDALCKEQHITQRVFNLGNPGEFTINELACKVNNLAKKYLNREVPIIYIENPDISDPRMRRPDISRAQTILGFTPRVSLDEGLERSLQFFLNQHSKDLS